MRVSFDIIKHYVCVWIRDEYLFKDLQAKGLLNVRRFDMETPQQHRLRCASMHCEYALCEYAMTFFGKLCVQCAVADRHTHSDVKVNINKAYMM